MTIDDLREYGANVDEGLGRCFGNAEFYLKLVNMIRDDQGFDKLRAALEQKDYKTAFDAAHTLKGVLGNLSLSPMYDPVSEITELLRKETDMDYSDLMAAIMDARDRFMAL
jgi:HPt (histidine-containing phosphotransfer) domain-containing protein